jgi:hypothetical protein
MKIVKIRALAYVNLLHELWIRNFYITSMKMADTSSNSIRPNCFRPFRTRPKEAPPFLSHIKSTE